MCQKKAKEVKKDMKFSSSKLEVCIVQNQVAQPGNFHMMAVESTS